MSRLSRPRRSDVGEAPGWKRALRAGSSPCPILPLALAAAFGLPLGADASGSRAPRPDAEPARVWPAPPETPRLAFVRAFAQPTDFGVKLSGLRRFSNWLTGAQKGNEPLLKPFALALDEQDNLCVTDTGANAVCFLDRAANRWLRWSALEHRGGRGRAAILFASPVAVAKRGQTIFVADSARGSVLAFDLKGQLQFQLTNRLQRPSGLALAGDRLWVADAAQHSVLAFNLRGEFRGAFGQRGTGPGEFNFPTHLATDPQGRLYVTDSMNARVQVFDADGRFLSQLGKLGDSPGHFGRPKGVAVDRRGRIYVVDALFDTLQIFDPEGRLLLNLGEPGAGPGEFWLPNGIAISRNDEIFIADAYNRRIQMLRYIGPE
ncbi:MAG: 6-bladed beta-propeller [Verrucomicrobiae bacterium]|nr:6-bladed beta-propeller [Verrucomicrobiae bacterium]